LKILLFAPFGHDKLSSLAQALKDDTVKIYSELQAADLLEVMDTFDPELVVMFWDGSDSSEEKRTMSNRCWDLIRIVRRYRSTIWVVDDYYPHETKDYQRLCDKVFDEDLFTPEVFAALIKAASPVLA